MRLPHRLGLLACVLALPAGVMLASYALASSRMPEAPAEVRIGVPDQARHDGRTGDQQSRPHPHLVPEPPAATTTVATPLPQPPAQPPAPPAQVVPPPPPVSDDDDDGSDDDDGADDDD
ncbi:MAG TPA: hypothetical protein VGD67_03725 [Pseudonocardiaceae bacterium]